MKKTSGFVWNMIGSACYSLSSILYLMVVTRICGPEEGGFFSLAYATAQLLLSVGRYGMRTYQATDLREQYSFREYIWSRVISVSAMAAMGAVYSLYAFQGKFIAISFLVVAMKAIDAVEDVYHGRLQQTHNVARMGQAQALRNVYTPVCFSAVLILTKDLLLTLAVTVSTSLVVCIAVNQYMVRRYAAVSGQRRISGKSVVGLIKSCTGIFVGTFLSLLLYNIPKYAMAGVLSPEYQTYYSILFMPSFVVTLLCEFIFKPTITTIAGHWFDGEYKRFDRAVLACLGFIVVCTVFVTLAGHLLGRRLLELLYGVDLSAFKLHFVVLLIGGGICSCVYMLYNILIAIRHGGSIKTVYAIVAVASILVVNPMISRFGMMGAAMNYLFSGSMLLVIFASILLVICRER